MNLRQLKFFVTVAEELHFGRAADRLCMTQPPLSQAILALEQELSVTLFKRTKRHVALTPFGEHLLPYAQKLLEDAAALPGLALQLARGEYGTLKLGFVSTAGYNILPALVSAYGVRYPDVKVSLKEMTSDLQIDALLQGDINVGIIIPMHATLHPSLAYMPLFREPLVVAAPEEWVQSGRIAANDGTVSADAVAAMPLVLFPRKSAPAFHDTITSYFTANRTHVTIGQEAIQMQTIISLVSAGMGVALVPGSLKKLGRSGVRYLSLQGQAPVIETGIVWSRDDPTPTVKRFVDLARMLKDDDASFDDAPRMAAE